MNIALKACDSTVSEVEAEAAAAAAQNTIVMQCYISTSGACVFWVSIDRQQSTPTRATASRGFNNEGLNAVMVIALPAKEEQPKHVA